MMDFSKLDIEPIEVNDTAESVSSMLQPVARTIAPTELASPKVELAYQSENGYCEDEDFVSKDFVFKKIRTLVISCGNAGGNILKHIVTQNPCEDVEYFMTDTDYAALTAKKVTNCRLMLLGEKTCKGYGAGMRPEIAEAAANESEEKLRKIMRGASLVFVVAGEGGGSGTGCSPVVARIAKEEGAIVIAMVTKPFRFEGKLAMDRAISGINALRQEVDAIEIIDNQKVYCIGDANIPASVRFSKIDEFVSSMVAGFVNITRDTSTVKLDFQDLKKTLELCQGDMFIGVGESSYDIPVDGKNWDYGENAMMEAVERAISCPLIDGVNMQNAKGVIALYLVGNDIPLEVLEKAQNLINEKTDEENANIIWGADFNEKMNGKIKVFFIVAGLNSEDERVACDVKFISETGKPQSIFDGEGPFGGAKTSKTESVVINPIFGARNSLLGGEDCIILSKTAKKADEDTEVVTPATETKIDPHVMPKIPKDINGGSGILFANSEKNEKAHTPSIYGNEGMPDFMRIQCQ